MAVEFTRRTSGHGAEFDDDNRRGTVEWDAWPADNSNEVKTAAGFPVAVDDAWPDDATDSRKCDSIRIENMGGKLYRVVARYSVPDDGTTHTKGKSPDDPLLSPTIYEWQNVEVNEAIDRDINNKAIVNSAGQGPEQPVTRPFNLKRLIVTRYEPAYKIATSLTYENTVNAVRFEGAQPGEVRCFMITPGAGYSREATTIPVKYGFEFRAEEIFGEQPHQPMILDQGRMAFADIDGTTSLVRIVSAKTGDPVDGDVLLNGYGVPLRSDVSYLDANGRVVDSPSWVTGTTPAGATVVSSGGDAVFLRYQTLPAKDFNKLRL